MSSFISSKLNLANFHILNYLSDIINNSTATPNFKLYSAILFWSAYFHEVTSSKDTIDNENDDALNMTRQSFYPKINGQSKKHCMLNED